MHRPLLGCIADDYTGGSDLAGVLARRGLSVIQCFGIPQETDPDRYRGVDAVIVSLKSRSIPLDEAVACSIEAANWLRDLGVTKFYFKYCSTFDSTPQGNIGPVAEALVDWVPSDRALFCPSFPANGRTLYHGHLFVHGTLLSESGMRHHPLTPMTDSFLPRFLQLQSKREVGLLDWNTVAQGVAATKAAVQSLVESGKPLIVADAICAEDLATISDAVCDQSLFTGGSAWAGHLADCWLKQGTLQVQAPEATTGPCDATAVVLSGSCSVATREQIATFASKHPIFKVDVRAAARGENVVSIALDWAKRHLSTGPVLIYTTADPDELAQVQAELTQSHAATIAEKILADIADALVQQGVHRLVVAGGETSGAIINRLGIDSVRIGPEIAPGVPWVFSIKAPQLSLALKSGNFGRPTFFSDALEMTV